MYCFYYAITRMHLGEAMLLKMTAPLFIPFVALFWLQEKLTVRRLSRSEPTARTVFYFALTGALVSALPLAWAWQTPSAGALLWMLAVALFATLGQLLMTRGFALAPAGQLSAFTYASVVFGSFYGWVLWEEAIRWSTVAGALLVALAGVLAARARRDREGAIA